MSEYVDWEHKYGELVKAIMDNGERKQGRNGYTRSIFGQVLKIDVQTQGFPVLQGRKMFYKGVLGEVAAVLAGAQSVEDFEKHGCNYWGTWADSTGRLNLDYGRAWRDFNGVDQLAKLRATLKNNPNDRRMLISGWRPEKLAELSLPCCHMLYQWYVRDTNTLDMIWYQRSVDTMVGLPSDIIFATAWNMLLANELGMQPGELTFMLGDTHIYEEHLAQVQLYLSRLKSNKFTKVGASIHNDATVDNFSRDMVQLVGYEPLEVIKFELKG